MNDRTISIFEEYCNSVEILPTGDSVEVKVQRENILLNCIQELCYTDGVACLSIISDESDNHIAMFVENGALGMLDSLMGDGFDMNEMFGDDFKDDESDWWKKSE